MAAMPPLIVMFPLAALEMAASDIPRNAEAERLVDAGVIACAPHGPPPLRQVKTTASSSGS